MEKTMTDAKLLSEPKNYAIVQLPQRRFPGVVFQGDSLNNLINNIKAAVAEPVESERQSLLKDVIEHLETVQKGYEKVLAKNGIRLPYSNA
jgi:predicted RNase H-like HicB family nuclease